jgi:hypothetical protein
MLREDQTFKRCDGGCAVSTDRATRSLPPPSNTRYGGKRFTCRASRRGARSRRVTDLPVGRPGGGGLGDRRSALRASIRRREWISAPGRDRPSVHGPLVSHGHGWVAHPCVRTLITRSDQESARAWADPATECARPGMRHLSPEACFGKNCDKTPNLRGWAWGTDAPPPRLEPYHAAAATGAPPPPKAGRLLPRLADPASLPGP